jgi:hypothetical protein
MDQDISGENLNNMHWKNKLEDVEHLSTATLQDKNAAWEKLHSRLHQPPRRIKAIWYWAAAACLLTAILVPILTANKKQPETAANVSKSATTNKAAVQRYVPVKENAVITVPSDKINKAVTIQTDQPVNNKKINTVVALVKSVIDSTVFREQKNIPATQNIALLPLQIPVTSITTSVAVTEKKKLKVVHINELGDPVLEPRNTMHPDDYGVIQFKLINQQVYNISPVPVNSVGFNISKSKNVSSN